MTSKRYFPLFAALLLILFSQSSTSAGKIKISSGHWPPYLSQALPENGFLAQIVSESFRVQGYDVELVFLPWSRSLAMVKAGRYAASAVWSCTEARSREFLYSASILPYQYVFYHRADEDFEWSSFDDLKGKSVGLTQDYSYGTTLSGTIDSGFITADVTTSDLANFKKLLLGRIDLFPMDPVVGEAIIKNQLPAQSFRLAFHPKPLRQAHYHLLFDKDSTKAPELRRAFNQGLAELRESGRYEAIIANAIAANSQPATAEMLRHKLVDFSGFVSICNPGD
ncbi:substrate-binding periplasmic protein [Marinobacter halotolerans]|uniref:substrate-binding periplasmic protein n=1 Tax=Marinobacter halotolerans TaxID=1569211 RepID=UPI00124647C2|nr:transporter substrate-binding domain-containing protein [Marinobacter halotolerans]